MPIIEILLGEGYLIETKVPAVRGYRRDVMLTYKGILAADDLLSTTSSSPQGFVAMSFADDMNDVWIKGFDPGIRAAGFQPHRIDKKDYIGGITDEIMAQIRKSRFVVADYTHQNNGVYFEAGFVLGMGIIVIPTCKHDQIEDLHFDIQHLNTLKWRTPEELAMMLSKRIRAVVGAGIETNQPLEL
jgi:hypothetical protein